MDSGGGQIGWVILFFCAPAALDLYPEGGTAKRYASITCWCLNNVGIHCAAWPVHDSTNAETDYADKMVVARGLDEIGRGPRRPT